MSEVRRSGSIARALLWVVGGLLGAVVVFLAVSPELAGSDPGLLFGPIGLVSLAAVPGVILLGLAAVRRARLGAHDQSHDQSHDHADEHAEGNR